MNKLSTLFIGRVVIGLSVVLLVIQIASVLKGHLVPLIYYDMNVVCYNNIIDPNNINPIILIESLEDTQFNTLGGLNHWFHLAERLIPYLPEINSKICNYGNTTTIYIVFEDNIDGDMLDPFTRYLLSSILTCSKYNTVIYGYLQYNKLICDNDITLLDNIIPIFTTNINIQDSSKFFIESYNGHYNKNTYGRVIQRISWDKAIRSRQYTFNNLDNYKSFITSSYRSCKLTYNDKISTKSRNYTYYKINKQDYTNNYKINALSKNQLTMKIPCNNRNVLLYQRNKSRQIVDTSKLIEDITTHLSKWNRGNNTKCSNKWTVSLITHSNSRPPCELLDIISKSSIIITSHGFQSLLLLYQPIESIFIEIFPYMYYKPTVYGSIQLGLKYHLNLPRVYLSYESDMANWYSHIINYIFSKGQCINHIICRYISKKQNVIITNNVLTNIFDILNKFITHNSNSNINRST